MISVVVVTYNQATTLPRTLDAILRQQCRLPIEIVIGDDCSTDGTPQLCDDYAQRYPEQVRVLHQPANKGVAQNYFDCLLACRGDLIADCAGDDFWIDDQKLAKELQLMESDPDITLVHTAWQRYDAQRHTVSTPRQQPFTQRITDGSTMLEAILTQTRTPIIHLCTALYRTDAVMQAYHSYQHLFRHNAYPCEDLQITFLLARSGKIGYLPDVTLNYTQGGDSVSTPATIRQQFGFYQQATQLSYELASQFQLHSPITQRFFNQRAFAMLMYAFRAHDPHMRHEALACQQRWQAQNTGPILLVKHLTACQPLWRLALGCRQVFILFKRLFSA